MNLILTIALSLAKSHQSSCLVVQLINLPTSMLLLVEIFYYVMSLDFSIIQMLLSSRINVVLALFKCFSDELLIGCSIWTSVIYDIN